MNWLTGSVPQRLEESPHLNRSDAMGYSHGIPNAVSIQASIKESKYEWQVRGGREFMIGFNMSVKVY